ncbi:MAG: EamA family transporter [Saprospiraceae bacterium]|nr:EamA family transporter [Saprospiraceae bacterium]
MANVIFYRLIQQTNAGFGSAVTFLIPMVASLWALFDGEEFTIFHLGAMVCILLALIIIRRQ